jgi:glycosyltransferase involved in cell wall biosynthesis
LVGIGSLTPGKNWELAVRAVAYLAVEYTLDIAGDGPCRSEIADLISRLGLDERVRLLGYQPDITSRLDGYDIVLHPSLSETFCYSMMEAADAHLPVVAVDRPVMNELVPVYVPGVVASPDPRSYAGAVLRVAEQKNDFARSTEARNSAFDPDLIVKQWAELAS